jgi:hypothetical protein
MLISLSLLKAAEAKEVQQPAIEGRANCFFF